MRFDERLSTKPFLDGRSGAILGSALGGAAGTAITTSRHREREYVGDRRVYTREPVVERFYREPAVVHHVYHEPEAHHHHHKKHHRKHYKKRYRHGRCSNTCARLRDARRASAPICRVCHTSFR